MTSWRPPEPFCTWVRRRRVRRAQLLEQLYRNAANEHSVRLVDKLAERWQKKVAGGFDGKS